MNVLLIGAGGREHALAWALRESPMLEALFIAPGNPGTAACGRNVPLNIDNHPEVIAFCRENNIDFVIIGGEKSLAAGLVDDLERVNIKAFGPTKNAAQLESSKLFTKRLCQEADVPTPAFACFSDSESTHRFIAHETVFPVVIKYDGLMAGKGVFIAKDLDAAQTAVDQIYREIPDAAVLVESFIMGKEVSFFCLVDEKTILPLTSAQDYKRAFDGDEGPNTGGMGACSPAPIMSEALEKRICDEIIKPTLEALSRKGVIYRGALFAGIMVRDDTPYLLEYNCRFGDPECQTIMLRLKSDILALLRASALGTLKTQKIFWRDETAVTVVMAAKGYPALPQKGTKIQGLDAAAALPGVTIFHAGTRAENSVILADGGRVLNVSALGKTRAEASERAYAAVAAIDWPDGWNRTDIAR